MTDFIGWFSSSYRLWQISLAGFHPHIGYGKFHWLVLILCGWAVSSDAIEVLSVSFMLPSAEKDLKMSSQDKGWLNAIIFVGELKASKNVIAQCDGICELLKHMFVHVPLLHKN
jgi:hypothetical protein